MKRTYPDRPIINIDSKLFDRTPPHSSEAERAVVGGMIIGGTAAVAEAREYLGDGDDFFYDERLTTIYRAVCAVAERCDGMVNALLVMEHLRDAGTLEDVGGTNELRKLSEGTPGPSGIKHYAGTIKEKARQRRVIAKAGEVIYRLQHGEALADLEPVTAELAEIAGEQDGQDVPISFGDLHLQHPHLLPPVIDGLLRQGETGNIIAAPKIGKSWLGYGIGLSVVTGRPWLGAFPCTAGPVLLIDNELHPATIAHRIPKVAEAMGIDPAEYADRLDVLSLRGMGVSVHDLRRYIDRIKHGYYRLIIADAWYRFIPTGMNENSNADVMMLYNVLDGYAARTGAAWIAIHHASKGNQGEKAITDVGAGAGAQSRAADAHLILRPHEDEGCVVLEAAVRSFAPVDPVGLRWTFPVWARAYALDTTALKGRKTRGEERQDERDAEGMEAIETALTDGPRSGRQIRIQTGMSKERAERLLVKLEAARRVEWSEATIRGGQGRLYKLCNPVHPVGNPVGATRPGGPDLTRSGSLKGDRRPGTGLPGHGPTGYGPTGSENEDFDIAAAANEAFPPPSLNGHASGGSA